MVVLGALVNGLAVAAGGLVGLVAGKRVPTRVTDLLMEALGLCVVLVAVQGMVGGGHVDVLVVVLSMVVGGVVGRLLDIDGAIRRLGDRLQDALASRLAGAAGTGRFAEGLVTATLFMGSGSMAIVGSLQSGISLDHGTLFAKAAIDCVVAVVMAASMGVGVPLASVAVFGYEAVLSLGASLLAPVLTGAVVAAMTVTGSLLLLAVGLNMLDITKIKVADLVPAAFVPLLLAPWL